MAARKKGHAAGKRAAKPATVQRSSFRSVEISILGTTGGEEGALSQVIAESFAMARAGLSGAFKVNGIRAEVRVGVKG